VEQWAGVGKDLPGRPEVSDRATRNDGVVVIEEECAAETIRVNCKTGNDDKKRKEFCPQSCHFFNIRVDGEPDLGAKHHLKGQ